VRRYVVAGVRPRFKDTVTKELADLVGAMLVISARDATIEL
jgi:hypothetical protein